jgi:hypothetical protein
MRLARKSVYLLGLAVACVAALLVFAIVRPGQPVMPNDFAGKLGWLQSHPSDYVAASGVTEGALDTRLKQRFELWRAAHDLAMQLAPWRTVPRMAFVRSGLFHWYELPPRDRASVLRAAAPLMRDSEIFGRVAQPLWELTGDFAYLRRYAPHDVAARDRLSRIAATNGLFADYRSLRQESVIARLHRFSQIRSSATQSDLIELLPDSFDSDDEPLLRSILDELRRRPLEAAPSRPAVIDRVVDYALRHHVEPLGGLEALADLPGAASEPARARVALHLGKADGASRIEISSGNIDPAQWADYFDERAAFARAHSDTTMADVYAAKALVGHMARAKWMHLCADKTFCTSGSKEVLIAKVHPLSLAFTVDREERVPAYVEIFLDEKRVAEGEVLKAQTFTLGTPSIGAHPIDVRVVNPFTPQARERRLRLQTDAL